MKTFLSISKNECIVIYREVNDNANSKWHSANILAQNKDYGTAIALHIISIEESLKALLLLLDGVGFNFRAVKGIKKLFTNHELRHIMALLIFLIRAISQIFIKVVTRLLENDEILKKLSEKYSDNNFDDLFKDNKYSILRTVVTMRKDLRFFSQIERIRQNGFYSDYNDKLLSPLTINEDEYQSAIPRLSILKNSIDYCIALFKDTKANDKTVKEFSKKIHITVIYTWLNDLHSKPHIKTENVYKNLEVFFVDIYFRVFPRT